MIRARVNRRRSRCTVLLFLLYSLVLLSNTLSNPSWQCPSTLSNDAPSYPDDLFNSRHLMYCEYSTSTYSHCLNGSYAALLKLHPHLLRYILTSQVEYTLHSYPKYYLVSYLILYCGYLCTSVGSVLQVPR